MVIWNESPTVEEIYLGEEVHQIDIWGRQIRADMTKDKLRQRIRVDTITTYVTGVSEQITRWRMAVEFDKKKLPSVFSQQHRNGVRMTNFFTQGAGGEVTLVTPKVWKVYPQTMTFKLAVGEELSRQFEVEFLSTASSGSYPVRIDFDVNVDRRYRFSVWRDLDIGLGDVTIDLTTKLDPQGNLIVEQRMTNTNRPASRVSLLSVCSQSTAATQSSVRAGTRHRPETLCANQRQEPGRRNALAAGGGNRRPAHTQLPL